MNERIKSWYELTLNELYAFLQLRSEVFVVEQNCVYQDVDGMDEKAHHVMFYSGEGELTAYCRLFLAEEKEGESKIGRVLVAEKYRKEGLGKRLMNSSLEWLEKQGYKKIRLEAQTYLIRFYSDFGFRVDGEEYLEDGIPHISMKLGSD